MTNLVKPQSSASLSFLLRAHLGEALAYASEIAVSESDLRPVSELLSGSGGAFAHGTSLPLNPAVGQTFLLTNTYGENLRGFYYCAVAGTWVYADVNPVFVINALTRTSSLALSNDIAVNTSGGMRKASLTVLRTLMLSGINPFTNDYQAKLDGIEYGAQVNPRHVSLPFRTANGSSAQPGEIFFIKSDNSEWNSGSSNDIAAIELDREQCTLQQNPQVDNGTYTGWHSLPEDIVQNGGSTIWTFQRIADSSPFGPISGTLRIQSERIVKNTDGNYVLQALHVLEGLDNTFGSGVNWQVVGVFAPPTGG